MIGKTLGNFECTALLGKGGMGEVYRAKDQKLGRDVAIKVLPEEFAKDADRVARFQREAKLLASLNHPNIAAIYGLEESDEIHFLVLELIEGDTLADRLKHGAIPVEESLKLALRIAEAFEAAHEKGVIHRDLKPANIKVTPDGKVKVLDFGLAKAFAGEQEDMNLSNSPTLSVAATQQGVILGTAAYMSPEQAKGKTVDKKTDVWAFGCVLFEMLTGEAAIQGDEVSEILASAIKGDTNLDLLPAGIHPRVREVIGRCLQKDLRKRYPDIANARYEIEQVLADPSGLFVQPVPAGESRTEKRKMLPWLAAALILGAIIAGAAVWNLKPTPAPEPREVTRFEYELPKEQQLGRRGPLLSISPDGSQFVYCTSKGLYLRSMNDLNARFISGTDEHSLHPFFSPDGQWIGYWSEAEQQLKKIAIIGGTPIKICDTTKEPYGLSWGIDDTIVYIQSEGIMRIPASGGDPELIVDSEGGSFFQPKIIPDSELVLFTIHDGDKYRVAVQSLESGERKILVLGGNATYFTTGHLVYFYENDLRAVPFDPETLELAGSGPVTMVEGIQILGGGDTGASLYDISASGTLVYIPKQATSRILAKIDREGRIDQLNATAKAYVSPRVSPDGTRVAVQSIDADSGGILWIYDLAKDSAIRQLTFEGNNTRPIWTPDNKRITFSSDRDGAMSIYWMPADGGVAERLTTAEDGTSHWPDSWSPDGKTLAYTVERTVDANYAICFVSQGGEAECIDDGPNSVYMGAQFSPDDGRWIAYSHSPDPDPGQVDVYVEPFPPTGAPDRITHGGGRGAWPMWSPDGRELFYRPSTGGGLPFALKAVDINTTPKLTFSNERTLPIENFSTVSYHRGFDITPDGTEFIMTFPGTIESSESENRKIIIVENWLEELKERVPIE